MGCAHGSDVARVGGGEEAESEDSGRDGGEVPQELENAARPVQVVLPRVGVPEEEEDW